MTETLLNRVSSKTLVFAGCALAIAALSVYLVNIARYASRMPYWDDYDAVLAFLSQWLANPGQHWEMLTAQHNEHRLFFSRLLVVADYKLNGHVSMRQLIWIGNAGWLASIGMLWWYARRVGIAFAEFAPVVIVLLAFSHRDLMVWAMASSQQYFQLAFSIGAILLLTLGRLAPALGLFVLSAFTGGGGLLLAPVFGGYLMVHQKWKALALTSAVVLLTAYAYFIGLPYVKPAHHPTTLDPTLLLAYVLTFMGSAANGAQACYALAVAVILSMAWRWRQVFVKMPLLGWFAVYVVLTATVAGVTRAGFGVEQARSGRYTEYSLLLIALAYLGHLGATNSPRVRAAITGIGLVASTALFAYWYSVDHKKKREHFRNLDSGVLVYPHVEHGKAVFKRACEDGVLAAHVCAKAKF